jgi:hypothetical protein
VWQVFVDTIKVQDRLAEVTIIAPEGVNVTNIPLRHMPGMEFLNGQFLFI